MAFDIFCAHAGNAGKSRNLGFHSLKGIKMRKGFITFLFWGLIISIGLCRAPLDYKDLLSDFRAKFQIHVILDLKENEREFINIDYSKYIILPDVSGKKKIWLKLNKFPEISGDLVENIRCFGQDNQGLIQIFLSPAGTEKILSLINNRKDKIIALVFNKEILQEIKVNELNPNTALGLTVNIKSEFSEYSHLFFPVSFLEKVFIKAVEMENK